MHVKSSLAAALIAAASVLLLGAQGQLLSASADEGVTAESILLGTSTPLTGPVGPPCKPISDASQAWFSYVNAQGGINGRKIENIVLDDAYKAPEALANGRELAAKPVFAFFGGCGTLQPPVLLPIAKENGLLYLFPFAGNPELMTTDFVYTLFPLYAGQYGGLTAATLKQHGAGSVFFVAADVAGVDDNIAAVKDATEAGGGTFLGAERINQQESDYTPLALKIKDLKPDYLAIHTTAPASARLVKALVAQDAMPSKYVLAAATQATPSFLQSVVGMVDGKMLLALPVVPATSERAQSCLDALQQYVPDLPVDVFSLWGCAIAQVFTAALQDTPEPVTRESFAATLMSWNAKEASPLLPPLTFNNASHLGLSDMILAGIADNQPVAEGELSLSK